jgi:mRNA-degrading endonuclease RelE of RelBE toxin-antitoxin system
MKILLEKAARKGFDRMPGKSADAILCRLEGIAADPFARYSNVEAMKGMKDAFRLRQSDWRAVYRIDRNAGEMRVVLVDVRGNVYR